MRLNRLILAAAMMSLAACSKEEIPEVPKPNQEQTGKPEDKPVIDESICMKLSPTLQNMVEARSGVITQWQTGNRMGSRKVQTLNTPSTARAGLLHSPTR